MAAEAAAAAAAAAAIAGNVDLVCEILSRLPPKSLIRFKIVCKSWLSLISSPAFIADHTRRRRSSSPAISDLVVLVHRGEEGTDTAFSLRDDATSLLPDPSLSFIDRTLGPTHHSADNVIWNTCNGLLLCMRRAKTSEYGPSPPVYRFWVANPTTMELKEIPTPPPVTIVLVAGVVFDPSAHPGHYRVVCFGCRTPYSPINLIDATRQPFEFATYYSETGAWGFHCKTTCNLHPDEMLYSERRGVFWKGMLNWVNLGAPAHESILSFDAEQQMMHITPLPVLPDGLFRLILSFHESGGRLLLIESHHSTTGIPDGSEDMRFDIRAMGVELSGWSLLYRVDLAATTIENLFPEIYVVSLVWAEKLPQVDPVLVVPQGEDADGDVLLLTVPGKIVAYCLRSKTFRVVRVLVPTKKLTMRTLGPWDVFTYTHTLFSP